MSDIRAQRRRPTIAKEWQLAVLKQLQSESGNPTEEQRSAAAAETGLDEKWVRNWFTRQRSKLAARNRKGQPATTYSATVPTFRLQLSGRRSASTPIDLKPNRSRRRSSPATPSSRPPQLTVDNDVIPRSHRTVSAPVYSNSPPVNTVPSPHATTIPTYSRDPLCNRYPDFSQFFLPQAHQRPHAFELSTPIDGHNRFMQLLANSNIATHPPMFLQGLSPSSNPSSLAALSSCPVAFSMRLVDVLSRH